MLVTRRTQGRNGVYMTINPVIWSGKSVKSMLITLQLQFFFKKNTKTGTFFYCASSLKTGHYLFYSDFFGPQTLFLYKYVLALDVCFDLYGRIHFCLHDACYRVYEVPARILSVNSTSDLYIKIIIW